MTSLPPIDPPVDPAPANQPAPRPASPKPPAVTPPKDRRTLYGLLIFFGLIFVCFGFALILLKADDLGPGPGDGPRIGIVEIKGAITGSTKALKALRSFQKNELIKGIVVRINSPGGAVGPSQEIYRELRRIWSEAKKHTKKPVVASMGTVAASGGYYIAAGAQKVVASRGTITGSIGVITQTTNVEELLALARIRSVTFKTGKFKDTLSPLRAMDDEEKAYVQRFVDKILAQFVDDVAKGRKLPVAKVKKVADGRLLTGEEAKTLGLVDELGNLYDAIDLAAKLAKGEGDPVPVFHEPKKSVLQELLSQPTGEALQRLADELRSASNKRRIEVRDPRL